MTEFASLQPGNRGVAEVELERVGAGRISGIPNPIRSVGDPLETPASTLPFVAWERAVGVWDDEWPEWLKRKAAERSIYLRQRTGTLEAYEGWLDLLGATIVEVIAPPGGCFATAGRTEEDRKALLARFAQLRITFRRSPGPGDDGCFYALSGASGGVSSHIGHEFAVPGTAVRRRGRRATIVDGGTETEVSWAAEGLADASGQEIPIERIVIPGQARPGEPFVGRGFIGDGLTVAEDEGTTSRALVLGPDRSPVAAAETPLINRGQQYAAVVSIVPERVSERSETAERPVMIGGMVGDFVYPGDASERYYDRYYLYDESRITVDLSVGYGTFVGHSYAEITPFSAELRIDFPGQASGMSSYIGSFVGMIPEPSSGRLQKIGAAVRAGKSARDKISYTAQTKRIRLLQDGIPLDGTYSLGGYIEIARGAKK